MAIYTFLRRHEVLTSESTMQYITDPESVVFQTELTIGILMYTLSTTPVIIIIIITGFFTVNLYNPQNRKLASCLIYSYAFEEYISSFDC